MNKEDFLKKIANEGYNIGMGCNKSYATFDFLDKFPTIFSVITFSVSLLQIAYDNFPYAKELNITLLIISFYFIYLEKYNKKEFCDSGIELTKIEKEIKDFYFELKNNYESAKLNEYNQKLDGILVKAQNNTMFSHLIIVTDFIAHYKLFFQKKNNSEWFCEELKLTFFKDKVPETLKFLVVLLVLALVVVNC